MRNRYLWAVLAMAFLGPGLAACDRNEGPAERAGERIDESLDEAGDRIERAGEKVEDATDR